MLQKPQPGRSVYASSTSSGSLCGKSASSSDDAVAAATSKSFNLRIMPRRRKTPREFVEEPGPAPPHAAGVQEFALAGAAADGPSAGPAGRRGGRRSATIRSRPRQQQQQQEAGGEEVVAAAQRPQGAAPPATTLQAVLLPAVAARDEQQLLLLQGAAAADPPGPSPPVSSKTLRFPLRPGKGRMGQKCMIKANHFFAQLQQFPDYKDLHQYDVSDLMSLLVLLPSVDVGFCRME